MHITTKLPSWLILLCLVHLCRCQFFQRIFAPALQVEPSRGLDEYLEEVERQAERQVEEGYGHHPRHPHHHNHHNHRRHHRSRHHVTRDQMASPSIRHTNEDVFPSSDQLALMRDLNHKIDRQFRQSFHSKPFPLQFSASHPVLCKSPHIAANQLFADQSHNLMDSQSSALTAKSGDIEFHPSNYPKDFNPILFPNPHMFEPKVIPSDPFQDLDYGNADHADVFARGFSYNLNQNNVREFGKSGRKKKKKKPLNSVQSSDDEFDRYMSDMVDDYPKPDFDEDWFEKDTMDTNQMLVKQIMPTQFKQEFTMFDPAQLRMTRVPKNKWTFMESVSSRLPADLRSKYRSNAKIWEEAMVDRNDKKKKTKNTSKAEKKSGLSTKSKKNDALSKHPDNPYEKLGIAGAAYPKERDQASFNSAGYLDLLPASKPTR